MICNLNMDVFILLVHINIIGFHNNLLYEKMRFEPDQDPQSFDRKESHLLHLYKISKFSDLHQPIHKAHARNPKPSIL